MEKRHERRPEHGPGTPSLGEQSQGEGNAAGPELALYRLVRWLLNRGRAAR